MPAVKKRPNVEPIQRTLFSLDKPNEAAIPALQEIARPFEIPGTQILLGTSSFTASGWEGSFYPKGMKSTNYLSYYAKQFRTVPRATAEIAAARRGRRGRPTWK
jgi:hypothetical protein